MNALNYAIDNSLITMGMEKWIDTQQWKSIEEIMKTKTDEFESPNDKLY